MSKSNTLLKLAITYSAALLLTSIVGITVLVYKQAPREKILTETSIQTEYIYVWVDNEINTETTTAVATEKYLKFAKEYEGKIGIFSEDGNLEKTIDVYVKTLPETDQRLLREGIILFSEDELRSLIEDYSS